tara:strand:- start:741 stop:1070 length:330 start_codon:yes stop_codon:yes gene_type:complete
MSGRTTATTLTQSAATPSVDVLLALGDDDRCDVASTEPGLRSCIDFRRTGVRGDRGAPLIAASTRASRPSSSLTASSAGVIALGAAPCDDGIESNESTACSMHHECVYT